MSYKHEYDVDNWDGDYVLQIEFNTIVWKGEIQLDDYKVWRGNCISGNISEYDPTLRECEEIERRLNKHIDDKITKFENYHQTNQRRVK
jgi:hypothetical protein